MINGVELSNKNVKFSLRKLIFHVSDFDRSPGGIEEVIFNHLRKVAGIVKGMRMEFLEERGLKRNHRIFR